MQWLNASSFFSGLIRTAVPSVYSPIVPRMHMVRQCRLPALLCKMMSIISSPHALPPHPLSDLHTGSPGGHCVLTCNDRRLLPRAAPLTMNEIDRTRPAEPSRAVRVKYAFRPLVCAFVCCWRKCSAHECCALTSQFKVARLKHLST